MEPGEQLVGNPQRQQPLPRPALKRAGPGQTRQPLLAAFNRERRDQVFLGGKVLIDRPLRILRRLGQPVHAQTGVALFHQHLPGNSQQSRLALPDLALLPCNSSHAANIDDSSKNVKTSAQSRTKTA